MAIKLADVVERNHVSFPVIEAHDKTIVGFYNGASGNAQQALKLYYNSGTKTSLTSDGTANNPVKLTALPYGADGGSTTAGPNDTLVVPTEKGGILTMIDEKLLSDAGTAVSTYVGAYLVNVVNQGSNSDSARDAIARLSELVQQFNRYETVNGATAAALDDAAGENFYLAGYSTVDNKMRKISMSEVVASIAAQINLDLVNGGIITETQAGGTGAVGDLNNDGSVSTADLLIFLSNFGGGSNSADDSYESHYQTFATAGSNSASFVPGTSPASSGGTFALSELTTFDYPTTITVAGEAFGFTSVSRANNAANFVKFNTLALGTGNENIAAFWHFRRVRVEVDFTINFDAPDAVIPLLYVKLTMYDNSSTTHECLYYMGNSTAAINNQGFHSEDFYGTGGGIPLGEDVPITCYADLGTVGIINHTPATNYENHSTDIEEGFMMDFADNSFNIKDVETRIFFVAVTESSTVTVNQIRNKIQAQ